MVTNPSGRCMANYNRWHFIRLELAVPDASEGLRSLATGFSISHRVDIAAIAKCKLAKGKHFTEKVTSLFQVDYSKLQ